MSHSPSHSSSSQSIHCPVETSAAWVMDKLSGSHRFEINSYSQATKLVGNGDYIKSAIFYVGGHAWTIRYYPHNYPNNYMDSETYVGLFVELASDATNVRALYNLELLDQNRDSVSRAQAGPVTFAYGGQYHGNSCFVKVASLILKDDCLTVRCTVTVLKEPRAVESKIPMIPSITAPPSDLHQHLEQLLESGEGADVTFEVCGTTFGAHRCVLAARSPVFKAQLFGQMKEKNMQCIKIEEMDDAVFKALLHFIYSDSVPPEMEEPQNSSSTVMAQHLLSAADRYELKRLKLICEEKLCQNIDVETVATTLALAEQHFCDRLKAACLEFIASPEKLIAVALTGGFDHLKKSCPYVLKELLEKFGFLSVKEA
ncbi:BTB/POZ and MATH domain-containing protein 1-like [Ananas comosus]|uniref:BTB/POZ and MATH domain-containing protein 1-like n=1 Tax=Ananas comosus TaxID=4615 RepID=A0A6P5EH54_ANACO|nr:BTB/POZ and MATH domain-containing protein 1-like [Ananas comosus]